MIRGKTKLAVALATALAISGVGATAVLAAAETDDSLSPASTLVKASLKVGTKSYFSGTVDGAAVTVSCTGSTVYFKTPASGLAPMLASNPTFTGCTDSLGGTDSVKSNSTNGRWVVTFIDAANDETTEGADFLRLTIPKAGVKIVSSVLPTCTVITAPAGYASVFSTYNDINTAVFKAAKIPTTGSGCTTSATGAFSANFVAAPGFHDHS